MPVPNNLLTPAAKDYPPDLLTVESLDIEAQGIAHRADGKVVLEHKRKHHLADLIAQCDPKAAPPADMRLWDQSKPAGQEVW